MATFPDYYDILGVPPSASPDAIKTACACAAARYQTCESSPTDLRLPPRLPDKRKSLQHHPDRIPAGPGSEAKRKAATVQFQAIADAYYTLSDAGRRAAYDRLRSSHPDGSRTSNAGASSSYFNFFNTGAAGQEDDEDEYEGQPDAEHVFGSVFEEMLRPEVNRHVPLWTWVGAGAGAVLGFIAGNLPGAAIGGLAGQRLGAVRDAKGKAVYQVFKVRRFGKVE